MSKNMMIQSIPGFMEIIHIELSNKGREVIMFEVLGQDPFSK